MCESSTKRSLWVCPTIFFVVFIGAIAGFGALFGVLASQSESCCMAVRACWNKQTGRILIGPCAGPLDCKQIIDYANNCTVQQQPIIQHYAGIGAAWAVALILAAGLICFVGALFIADTRNKMLAHIKNFCTCCRRTGYDVLE